MKKISFILAMLAFSLVFASCYTTPAANEPTQFEGTWLNLAAINEQGFTDSSVTFTGNTFVYRQAINAAVVFEQTVTGTFKFSKTRIQFTTRTNKVAQWYTLNDDELSLGRSSGTPFTYGSFTRQQK